MENKIDLSKCVVGQKLKLQCGRIVKFEGNSDEEAYPYKAGGELYCKNGCFYRDASNCPLNIVKILPLKQPKQKEERCVQNEAVIAQTEAETLYEAAEKTCGLLAGMMKQSIDMCELNDLEKEIDFAKRARQLADDIHNFYNL